MSAGAARILCEFLEVAVNGILFTRDIYPSRSFEQRKKYGIPVQICVHAEVKSYIENLMESLSTMIQTKTVHQFCVWILNTNQKPMEKFVFEVSTFEIPESFSCSDLLSLELEFRAFLLKIYTCDSILDSTVKGCTWKVEVHLQHSGFLEFSEKQLLTDMVWTAENESSSSNHLYNIVPLKSITHNILQLQLYVQEMNRSAPPSFQGHQRSAC